MNKTEIAKLLVDLKCVSVSPSKPFTYASGLKGPIYCDNRQLLSDVKGRALVADAFVEAIKEQQLEFDSVAGLATAGIAHAALVAERIESPMIYVRSKPKGHGKGNQIEGRYEAGQKILMIEDLVNQAKSLGDALQGVKQAELEAVACLSIVDYEMDVAKQRLKEWGLKLICLTDFSTIAQMSKNTGQISDEEYQLLLEWQKNPSEWSNKYA